MIVTNVRLRTAAGWYLGSIKVEDGEAAPYKRNSTYYRDEEVLKKVHPLSVGLDIVINQNINLEAAH